MELTEQQVAAAKASGCVFLPASQMQVAHLSMQRRIFTIDGRPFLATRNGGGFYETHGTLASLIEARGRGEAPNEGETVQQASAADSASAREIEAERSTGGGVEVRRPRSATRSGRQWQNPERGR